MEEGDPLVDPLAAPLPELEPAPALLELELPEPMEPEGAVEDEPDAALPLRLLCWSALDPEPALSRLHAAMPKASVAAVIAAVRIFVIAFIS